MSPNDAWSRTSRWAAAPRRSRRTAVRKDRAIPPARTTPASVRTAALATCGAALLFGCAHQAPSSQLPARAQVRGYHYMEPELDVTTLIAGVEQPVGSSVSLTGRLWADRVAAG